MKNRIFIIAEAGVNHNGSLALAKKMVQEAAAIGADAIKFQTFKARNLLSRSAPKAPYQRKNTPAKLTQYAMLKKLELDASAHRELIECCRSNRISFLSSAFDLASVDLLSGLGVKIFKIPSGEITNLPYLRKVGALKKEVLLSTGMADMKEVGAALGVLVAEGTKKGHIAVLQCTTEYPSLVEDAHLNAMVAMRDTFKVRVGYSDHTPGIEISLAAAALGAEIIEKHFTIDNALPGPDHRSSLEPKAFRALVESIRNIEKALGCGIKKPSVSELANRAAIRKSIVALGNIKKGDVFTDENIAAKRPGTGISPMKWDAVVGTVAQRNFKADDLIRL